MSNLSDSVIRLRVNKSFKELEKDSSKDIHYIPCKILTDEEANVHDFYTKSIEHEDNGLLNATFRGRPFNGKIINLPEKYRGYVFQERLRPLCPKDDRVLHATQVFKAFTYWNWDKIPSENDALIGALNWLDISEALHSPVEIKSETAENSLSDAVKSEIAESSLGDAIKSETAENSPSDEPKS